MAFKTCVDTGSPSPEMTFVRLAKGAWIGVFGIGVTTPIGFGPPHCLQFRNLTTALSRSGPGSAQSIQARPRPAACDRNGRRPDRTVDPGGKIVYSFVNNEYL